MVEPKCKSNLYYLELLTAADLGAGGSGAWRGLMSTQGGTEPGGGRGALW